MENERPDATVSKVLLQAALVPAVLAVVVAGVLAIEVNSLVSLSRWVEHTDQAIGTAHEVQGLLADRESGLRGYVLARSKDFLGPYQTANSALPDRFRKLERLVAANRPQAKRVTTIRDQSNLWEAYSRSLLASDPAAAVARITAGEGERMMAQMRHELEMFVHVEEGLRDERSTREQTAALRAVSVSVALLVAVAVLLALSGRRQIREVARRFGTAIRSLQEADRLRDDFLTVAAHELRTPLTALLLQLQRLRRELERGMAVKSFDQIDTPLRQARRLSSLIESLLDAQAVTSGGPVELRLSRGDLALIAQGALARVRDSLVRLGSEVFLHFGPGVDGHWDVQRIEHVVATLIANACKYGEGRPVRVEAHGEGDMRVLTVHDEGIGIAPEVQERIFARFGRAAPTRSYGGFGLSLFVARRLAEAHGGTLTVVSQYGKGATFTLRLPRVARSPALEPRELRAV
ncbi:MAG: CHASE3 domain-containing protein [Myxococcales bacterium]